MCSSRVDGIPSCRFTSVYKELKTNNNMKKKLCHSQNSTLPPLEQFWNTNNLSFILFYTLEILDCSSPDINIKTLKDDRCKEPNRRHSLSSEVKRKDRMVSTLDEHVYDELIDR
jgi:hypothetical protein